METDEDVAIERDRLRKIVAALWNPAKPTTDPTGRPLLGPAEARLASDCIAWAYGQQDPTVDEAEATLGEIFSNETQTELWRHIAYTMEATRDRLVVARDCLLDVAAAGSVLLACAEETASNGNATRMVREALQRYDKLRS